MHLFLTPFKVHAGIQCCGRNLCDHPHPCPIYIFKTPNGVAFLRLSFYETFAVLDLPVAQDCGPWTQ